MNEGLRCSICHQVEPSLGCEITEAVHHTTKIGSNEVITFPITHCTDCRQFISKPPDFWEGGRKSNHAYKYAELRKQWSLQGRWGTETATVPYPGNYWCQNDFYDVCGDEPEYLQIPYNNTHCYPNFENDLTFNNLPIDNTQKYSCNSYNYSENDYTEVLPKFSRNWSSKISTKSYSRIGQYCPPQKPTASCTSLSKKINRILKNATCASPGTWRRRTPPNLKTKCETTKRTKSKVRLSSGSASVNPVLEKPCSKNSNTEGLPTIDEEDIKLPVNENEENQNLENQQMTTLDVPESYQQLEEVQSKSSIKHSLPDLDRSEISIPNVNLNENMVNEIISNVIANVSDQSKDPVLKVKILIAIINNLDILRCYFNKPQSEKNRFLAEIITNLQPPDPINIEITTEILANLVLQQTIQVSHRKEIIQDFVASVLAKLKTCPNFSSISDISLILQIFSEIMLRINAINTYVSTHDLIPANLKEQEKNEIIKEILASIKSIGDSNFEILKTIIEKRVKYRVDRILSLLLTKIQIPQKLCNQNELALIVTVLYGILSHVNEIPRDCEDEIAKSIIITILENLTVDQKLLLVERKLDLQSLENELLQAVISSFQPNLDEILIVLMNEFKCEDVKQPSVKVPSYQKKVVKVKVCEKTKPSGVDQPESDRITNDSDFFRKQLFSRLMSTVKSNYVSHRQKLVERYRESQMKKSESVEDLSDAQIRRHLSLNQDKIRYADDDNSNAKYFCPKKASMSKLTRTQSTSSVTQPSLQLQRTLPSKTSLKSSQKHLPQVQSQLPPSPTPKNSNTKRVQNSQVKETSRSETSLPSRKPNPKAITDESIHEFVTNLVKKDTSKRSAASGQDGDLSLPNFTIQGILKAMFLNCGWKKRKPKKVVSTRRKTKLKIGKQYQEMESALTVKKPKPSLHFVFQNNLDFRCSKDGVSLNSFESGDKQQPTLLKKVSNTANIQPLPKNGFPPFPFKFPKTMKIRHSLATQCGNQINNIPSCHLKEKSSVKEELPVENYSSTKEIKKSDIIVPGDLKPTQMEDPPPEKDSPKPKPKRYSVRHSCATQVSQMHLGSYQESVEE